MDRPATVDVTAQVAALLPEHPDVKLGPYPEGELTGWAGEIRPFWHLERARIDETRDVQVELVVNAYPVAEQTITADGTLREVRFRRRAHRPQQLGGHAHRLLLAPKPGLGPR